MVHSRRPDVIVTGDIPELQHFHVIDPAKGGSIQGEIAPAPLSKPSEGEHTEPLPTPKL